MLESSHTKEQSLAYFEKSQIIYEGDFLEVPRDNTITRHMAQVEKEFIEFIRSEDLAIKRIIGHHRNNNISPKVMNAFYQANIL
ncbi:hypothetical protein [Thalassotalea ganghwensis]